MNAAAQCIETAPEPEARTCPYCQASFIPARRWQAFCSSEHRTAFDQEFGALGKIAGVRKLKSGVSVTLHFTGPAAERALNLELGAPARVTRKP